VTASAPALDVATREALAELLLTVADDEFVIGFWDSEWTGIAPMLEEDVATSSIAQDEIGHAKALYELLAELTDGDADAIAYRRDADEYRHASLLNHRRGDWAFSVARRWLYETADAARLAALAESSHAGLAALAGKMRREETYHLLHAEAWVRRLSAGAREGRERLSTALVTLWPDAQQVFAPLDGEEALLRSAILPEPMEALHRTWTGSVLPRLEPLIGAPPPSRPTPDGRRVRTDDFRWLHGQFTMVARSEEAAMW
jgi:ring-1,2-phenylacetyl-CoA epoxidase subunit PaaC